RESGLRSHVRNLHIEAARREDVPVGRRGAGGDGLEDRSGVRPVASSGATVIDETHGGGIMTPTHVDQLTETPPLEPEIVTLPPARSAPRRSDRKSTRLNSSHDQISYAVFC